MKYLGYALLGAVGVYALVAALAPKQPAYAAAPQPSNPLTGLLSLLPAGVHLAQQAFGNQPPIIPTSGGFLISPAQQQSINEYNAQPGTQYGIAGLDY